MAGAGVGAAGVAAVDAAGGVCGRAGAVAGRGLGVPVLLHAGGYRGELVGPSWRDRARPGRDLSRDVPQAGPGHPRAPHGDRTPRVAARYVGCRRTHRPAHLARRARGRAARARRAPRRYRPRSQGRARLLSSRGHDRRCRSGRDAGDAWARPVRGHARAKIVAGAAGPAHPGVPPPSHARRPRWRAARQARGITHDRGPARGGASIRRGSRPR